VPLGSIAFLLAQISVVAGGPILEILRRGFAVGRKADASPVTEADLAAENLIVELLGAQLPGIPVVAEELAAAARAPAIGERFILVDPLDGTREFMAHSAEFTVNLALVESGRPVVGAIYAPLLEQLWFADTECHTARIAPGTRLTAAAETRRITVRPPPPAGLVALVSRSHRDQATETYLDALPVVERRPLGSSLKFCLIAQGEADLYPRLGPTCEWDTAAGHAVLAAAGGSVAAPDGRPLRYGQAAAGFRHQGFVACGGFRLGDGRISVRN
jgi:3'(2'), 5'-bisphosphate nucleotidase